MPGDNETHRLELIRLANERISELSTQLTQIGRELSANQQSTTGLWHQVRSLQSKMESISSQFKSLIGDHEAACIAHSKAMQKALALDSDPPPPLGEPALSVKTEPESADGKKRSSFLIGEKLEMPKLFLWIVLVFCLFLIGSGIVIGALWTGGPEKAGKTIRDISGEIKKQHD